MIQTVFTGLLCLVVVNVWFAYDKQETETLERLSRANIRLVTDGLCYCRWNPKNSWMKQIKIDDYIIIYPILNSGWGSISFVGHELLCLNIAYRIVPFVMMQEVVVLLESRQNSSTKLCRRSSSCLDSVFGTELYFFICPTLNLGWGFIYLLCAVTFYGLILLTHVVSRRHEWRGAPQNSSRLPQQLYPCFLKLLRMFVEVMWCSWSWEWCWDGQAWWLKERDEMWRWLKWRERREGRESRKICANARTTKLTHNIVNKMYVLYFPNIVQN